MLSQTNVDGDVPQRQLPDMQHGRTLAGSAKEEHLGTTGVGFYRLDAVLVTK